MEAYGALRIFLIFIHVRVYCMRVYVRVYVHIEGIRERFDIISTLGETPVPRDWSVGVRGSRGNSAFQATVREDGLTYETRKLCGLM